MQNQFIAGRLSLRSQEEPFNPLPEDYPVILKPDDKFLLIRTYGFNQYIVLKTISPAIVSAGQIYSDKQKIPALLQNNDYVNIEGNFSIIEYTGEGTLKITNDKYGTRPLFYYYDDKQFIFSDHIGGIFLLSGKKDFSISRNSLIHFYHFGFTSNDSTLLDGIKKMPPGHSLCINGDSVELEKYFDVLGYFPVNYSPVDDEDFYTSEINKVLTKSIETRIALSGKAALGLSGGVDSGFIAKKLSDSGADVTGINLSYSAFYNEHNRIDELSKKTGIKLIKLIVTADDLIASFIESNSLSSEPARFNDAAMRLVALKAMEEGFDSLWDGDGADRLFFGMNRLMLYNRVFSYYALLKSFGLNKAAVILAGILPGRESKKLHSLLKNWNEGIPPYPERKLDSNCRDKDVEREIYNLAVNRFYINYKSKFDRFNLVDYFTYQSVMMCPEMFFHPPYELQKAAGLFPVSPYWHSEVVKLAFRIPASLKVKNGINKYILRKAAAFKDDKHYWMLPKIGLQNAYNFILTTDKGKKWETEVLNEMKYSDFSETLKEHLRSDKLDLKRLIPLYFWKKNL